MYICMYIYIYVHVYIYIDVFIFMCAIKTPPVPLHARAGKIERV